MGCKRLARRSWEDRQDPKALPVRGGGEPAIEAHEVEARRIVFGRQQGRGELGSIGRPEIVPGEEGRGANGDEPS
jgi:hypothetical protein